MPEHSVIVRHLGQVPYLDTFEAMKRFTQTRNDSTVDELWVVEHPSVFTQGQAGKAQHIIDPSAMQSHQIPLIQSDRGGQVTYHGPGQIVIYTLVNLKRQKLGVRALVSALEQSVVDTLDGLDIKAYPKPEAPGVYVNENKICSLGLRVKKGCSYHGLALNVDMDLSPFNWVNPCGYQGLKVTQVTNLSPKIALESVKNSLIEQLIQQIGYNDRRLVDTPWSKHA